MLLSFTVFFLPCVPKVPPPVPDPKAKFYLSEDAGADKLFNEGVLTIYNELDELKHSLRELMKPNGTHGNPARTCYDLFLCYPSFPEGRYWIDPNMGSNDDAVEVYCRKPGCSCVEDKNEELKKVQEHKKRVQVYDNILFIFIMITINCYVFSSIQT